MQEALESEFEALLERLVPGGLSQASGSPPEELAQLERLAGRPLPEFYRWFLSRFGRDMGPFAYPTLDFTTKRVLSAYQQELVSREKRFLLIAFETDTAMPLHLFYDLEAPNRSDALIFESALNGKNRTNRFETLREMLAWSELLKHGVNSRSQRCEGSFGDDDSEVYEKLDPVMKQLGFTAQTFTGRCCRLYDRNDASMVCRSQPDGDAAFQYFDLGGPNASVVRKILGAVAADSGLEVEVNSWDPELE